VPTATPDGRTGTAVYHRTVPPIVDTLLHPQRTPPPPIDVDLAKVMGAGTVVWAAALVVTGVLSLLDVVPVSWVLVCAAGVLLGIVGVQWARRNGRLSPDGTGAMVRPDDEPTEPPATDGTPTGR